MASGKKKRVTWTVLKIVGLALLICFIPNLRSCGNFSLGFPSVVYGAAQQDLFDFRPLNLAINSGVIGLSTFGLLLLYKRIKNDQTRRCVRSGFNLLGLYQLFVLFGYAAVYPFLIVYGENSVLSFFGMIYAYFIHPYLEIVQEVSNFFPDSLHKSFLFGDNYDLPMRIGYVLMCGAWFALGVLKARIFKGKKPAADPASPAEPPGTSGG